MFGINGEKKLKTNPGNTDLPGEWPLD